MTIGFMDGNKKFHPTSTNKGVSRKKRLEGAEQVSVEQGVRLNRSRHPESVRLKRSTKLKFEIPSPDPHEGGQSVLDTLGASKQLNGFDFYKLSKIKTFVLFGSDQIFFNKIPKNPHHVEKISVTVNRGSDTFTASFFQTNQFEPALVEKDLLIDDLAPALLNGLGIKP